MIEPISTDRKIPKEKFRIINFSVGNGKTIEDLVHNEPVLKVKIKQTRPLSISRLIIRSIYVGQVQWICFFIWVALKRYILNQK